MEELESIAQIGNDVEALCLRGELEERGIPHLLRSYYDSAYDGIYQYSGGWGDVQAPAEHKDEILAILEEIRRREPLPDDEMDDEEMDDETDQDEPDGES